MLLGIVAKKLRRSRGDTVRLLIRSAAQELDGQQPAAELVSAPDGRQAGQGVANDH